MAVRWCLSRGGVLVQSADGQVIGAVGITGDTSDNDEAAAVDAIEAAGQVAVGDWPSTRTRELMATARFFTPL